MASGKINQWSNQLSLLGPAVVQVLVLYAKGTETNKTWSQTSRISYLGGSSLIYLI